MSDVVRDTAVPLYLQIAQDIKGKIDRKEIAANSRIPTEAELSKAYQVSRITIRKAWKYWWMRRFWCAGRGSAPLCQTKNCQEI